MRSFYARCALGSGIFILLVGGVFAYQNRARTSTANALLKTPLKSPRIVVQKSERRLLLYSGANLVRTYRIALGGKPVGDKEREGDRRTPEGDFYITNKNPRSQFFMSLHISYPDAEAAERGRREKRITPRQYRQILQALRERRSPPQTTLLGGKILIHGGGSERDWTLGCVALDNREMQELYAAVPVGATVTIEP